MKRLTTVFSHLKIYLFSPGEHEDIMNQSWAFVDPPVINLIILERSDEFAVDINSGLIEVSKVDQ